MSDIELLFGLSSNNLCPLSPITNDNNEDSTTNRLPTETTGYGSGMHSIQMEIDSFTRVQKADSYLVESWSSSIHKETLSIAPANTPVLSPRSSRNDQSTPEISDGIVNMQSIKPATKDDDFFPRIFFTDGSHKLDYAFNQSKISNNSVTEALNKLKYNNDSSNLTSKSFNIFSSPPLKERNQSINTSVVSSNYTHQNTSDPVTIKPALFRQNAFNDSCAPNTILLDNMFTQRHSDFGVSAIPPRSREFQKLDSNSSNSTGIKEEELTHCADKQSGEVSLSVGYDLDDATYTHKTFNLSSSPFPTFEAKFPEPKLITDLFELEENDIIESNSKIQEFNESLRKVSVPRNELKLGLKFNDSSCLTNTEAEGVSSSLITRKPKSEVTEDSKMLRSGECIIRSRLSDQSSDLNLKLFNNKLKKSFRLEIDPNNIISSSNQTGRALRESTMGKSLNESDLFKEQVSDHLKLESKRNKRRKSLTKNYRGRNRKSVEISGRSKNGCWTCRIRKKKCTEEKPHCLQCMRLELRCDGYSPVRPYFMADTVSQRVRLDEIKAHTSLRKKATLQKVETHGLITQSAKQPSF